MNNKRAKRVLIFLCVFLVLCIAGLALVDRNIKPIALAVAEARVRAIASDAINNAVRTCVQGVTYADIIAVEKDDRGRVSMLQANSVRMNQIAADTTLTAQHFIAQIDAKSVSIPIGSVLGGPIFSGRGPSIPVKIIPAGSVTTSFLTNFSSAGINQTRHEIYLRLNANMRIAIPVGAKEIEVSILVPVAESVIVGDVPQTYVDTKNLDEALMLIPSK